MEKKTITIAGIITLLIILSSGTTLYVQDLGTKTGCRAGWEYVDYGVQEGKFKCVTSSGERYQVCFEVYDSSNTENYWCKKGVLVEFEKEVADETILPGKIKGKVSRCFTPNEGNKCIAIQ